MMPNASAQWRSDAEDVETCRGRAYHARMGAQEAPSEGIRAVFERLAASYEALAQELERLEQADGPTTFDALSQTVDRLTHTQAPGSEEPRP